MKLLLSVFSLVTEPALSLPKGHSSLYGDRNGVAGNTPGGDDEGNRRALAASTAETPCYIKTSRARAA